MAIQLNAPVILISGGSASSASVQAAATMITGAGAVPLILSNHLGRVRGKDKEGLYQEIHRIVEKADGVLVMGNNGDIDPMEYGQQKNAHTNSELVNKDGTVNPEGMARRNYETALMKVALEKGMPMFGICGGEQRINVICGGTLHQHIPEAMQNIKHDEHAQQDIGIPPFVAVQPVTIKTGSTLGAIAEQIRTIFTPARTIEGDMRLDVNSMHHQSVEAVGRGLRIAATADDVLKDGSKMVEAIEIDPNGELAMGPLGQKRFGIFTQWHPEFSENPLGAKISKQFAEAAIAFAKVTGRSHTLEEVQAENRISSLPVLKIPAGEHVIREGSIAEKIVRERLLRDPSFGLAK